RTVPGPARPRRATAARRRPAPSFAAPQREPPPGPRPQRVPPPVRGRGEGPNLDRRARPRCAARPRRRGRGRRRAENRARPPWSGSRTHRPPDPDRNQVTAAVPAASARLRLCFPAAARIRGAIPGWLAHATAPPRRALRAVSPSTDSYAERPGKTPGRRGFVSGTL